MRANHERPPAGLQGHPLIAIAAVHGHADVMDVLCVHGASVTLKALHYAADTRSCQVRLVFDCMPVPVRALWQLWRATNVAYV